MRFLCVCYLFSATILIGLRITHVNDNISQVDMRMQRRKKHALEKPSDILMVVQTNNIVCLANKCCCTNSVLRSLG